MMAILTVISLMTVAVYAASYPKATDNVADSAGILSEGTIRSIKNANEELSKEVGANIAVCTVATTGDASISDYARAVFKDWNLGESILLIIAVDDKNYYFLQSSGVDSALTNEEIAQIAEEYLEGDFTSGTPDTGVMKVVAKLSGVLASKLAKTDTEAEAAENEKHSGSFIITLFKAILYIVLILVVLFVILFVVALFNDDAAALLQKYVFRRNAHKQNYQQMNYQYDERLYGNQSAQRRPGAQRNPSQNGQYGNYSGQYQGQYPRQNVNRSNQQRTPNGNPYYNPDGSRRR